MAGSRLLCAGLTSTVLALGCSASQADASAIGATIASRISAANYQHYLDDLLYTHNGMSRGIGGAQHDLCRNNIQSTFQSFSLNTQLAPFVYSGNGQTYHNVVATKTGWEFPNAIY